MSDNRKRCSWLHDSMTITPGGDVYACCHHKPGIVGNIYDNTLEEIFNGDRVKAFRQQEIDGTLPCLKGCTLVQKEIAKNDIDRDYHTELTGLGIEFGERCNIACVMCTQDHKNPLELDTETLIRNVTIPKSRRKVEFYGGEPLILKSAKRFFDHCAEAGARAGFITNGTAISEVMAAKIAKHCWSICFSLNAASRETHEAVNVGSRYEKVLRNIRRVIQAKKDLDGDVHIGGHMTIVEKNLLEIGQFIDKREEFGFEFINFGYDWRVPILLGKQPDLKARLATEVQAAVAHARGRLKSNEQWRIQPQRLKSLGLV
jgi:radical SAM protein with 4Fe4S-binding SPASM domain